MKVEATKVGIYNGARRFPGDRFEINDESEMGSWMEPIADEADQFDPQTMTVAEIKDGIEDMTDDELDMLLNDSRSSVVQAAEAEQAKR